MDTFRYQDLRAIGLDEYAVRAALRRTDLTRIRHGGYRRGNATASPEQAHLDLIATSMPLLRADTVLSHGSAGLLWSLPVPWRLLGRVHVTRAVGTGRVSRWVHHHVAPLDDGDVTTRQGLPVTGLARTALDLARSVAPDEALGVLDAASRALGSSAELAVLSERSANRRGIAQARFALQHLDPRAESMGESRSRYWMIVGGLPLPDLQVELRDDTGALVARVDFGWLDRGLVGEFDGRIKYQSESLRPGETAADVLMREKRRENRIRDLGLWLSRWVNDDLADGWRFVRWLGRQLDARAPR